ncbi:hypothetical protein [uncultured Algimonas sp.]|uniref:hypothetical protein n=1 Tax=uncultured Algimonas sp. TaxID=1547920 RepID=UPI00261242C6|nr:hypothetical protein [uncultured Algimonas sp.]
MSRTAKLALILPFLLGLFMSVQAVFLPERLRETLGGLAATGPVGAASLYADFPAYFLTYTIGIGAALFAGRRDWLFAPIALFGLTAVGRIGHGLVNGFVLGALMPIGVEIVACALMAYAWRSRPVT